MAGLTGCGPRPRLYSVARGQGGRHADASRGTAPRRGDARGVPRRVWRGGWTPRPVPLGLTASRRLRRGDPGPGDALPHLSARGRRLPEPARPAGRPRRPRTALRGGARGPDPGRAQRASDGSLPRHRGADQHRGRAGAARPGLPPAVRRQPPLLRELHRPAGGHPHRRVPRDERRPGRSAERAPDAFRLPALREPQRGRPGLRQRRHALCRPGGRGLGGRSLRQRPEPGHPPRQDASDRRGPRHSLRCPPRQPVRHPARGHAGDLGLRPA